VSLCAPAGAAVRAIRRFLVSAFCVEETFSRGDNELALARCTRNISICQRIPRSLLPYFEPPGSPIPLHGQRALYRVLWWVVL